MSALKRKQPVNKDASAATKKRQKTEPEAPKPARAATDSSILSKELPVFPRGGTGTLTLLEQKQIRAQASRDALDEAELETNDLFATSNHVDAASDESDLDLQDIDEKQTFVKKSSSSKKQNKASRASRASRASKTSKDANSIRIDSVSHRRLNSDSLLLARITDVSSRELTLALPNNLIGFVPVTAVSTQLSSKIESSLQEHQEEESSASDGENDLVNTDLRQYFTPGQLLRVAVRHSQEDSQSQKESKKRIELSIEPTLVNKGLTRKLLTQHVTVQVSIASIEDHGAVVDLGLGDGTTGFVPQKSLQKLLDANALKPGAVFLCAVTAASSKGKAVQLSTDLSVNAAAKLASSVDALLPGTLVEVLLTDVLGEGLVGKVLGILDVTADALHSTAFEDKDAFADKYKIGQKINARLIANFPLADQKKFAFSVMHQLLHVSDAVEDRLALSSIIDRAQVISVVHGLGVYFSLPSGAHGFAHISRLSDKTIDMISESSGPYKKNTEHQARIIDFNPIDQLYILSLEKTVIEQPFLRLSDIEIGQVVNGKVEKLLVGETGLRGLLLKVADGITGFISILHLSDVALKTPEKKFREGMPLKARVLAIDLENRRLVLTLKKSLVNSDQPVWTTYDDLEAGQSTVGTLVKIDANGALVHFFGSVKGRLPVSEMSEAFIKDARDHFKLGQVLTVHILRVDPEANRLTLTARDPTTVTRNDTSALVVGSLASGIVFEKNADDLMLRLEPYGTIARLPLEHISDGSEKKRKSALEKIRVGQKMEDVLVLEVKGRQVILSNKASLRKASTEGKLLTSFADLIEDAVFTGFVSNITENRVFVRFAQGITGVINKPQIPDDQAELPEFGMKLLQAISVRVVHVDYKGAAPRFWLSMKASGEVADVSKPALIESLSEKDIDDPVDDEIKSYSDLSLGRVVKARITSVRETQLNIELAKGIQGRVDVSEIFDNIDDIHDRKRPLKQFSSRQVIAVKILGQHDSRSYKFLPLSHRTSKNLVFELSAKPSSLLGKQATVPKLEDMKVGESYLAFVNNVADHSLLVNVSPAVRGRIRASDVSDDLSLAANLSRNFPVGSVLKAKVTSVDVEKNRLDLSARGGNNTKAISVDTIAAGDIVPGRITKTTDRSVVIQLSDTLVGAVDLIEMADDFDLADPTRFQKNEVVSAYVLQVDKPNKKVYLSLRPSKVLRSGLDIKDPAVSLQELQINDVRRGFVNNVTDKGLFISLAHGVTAFVRVTNLSDEYLREWKGLFQKDQLVRGKIITLDKDSGHVQMSLRQSHIEGTYRPPVTFNDLKIGHIVEAKIAKVESFGVFIVVANSENVRGLCHRSEIAEKRIEDVTKLGFAEGDVVKAKVLKIEHDQRKINFGMKASYFDNPVSDEETSDEEAESIIDEEGETEDGDLEDAGVALAETSEEDFDGVSIDLNHDIDDEVTKPAASKGLSVGGFDWFGMPSTSSATAKRIADASDGEEQARQPKRKKKKSEILIDRTGDLDKDGPQSVDDFERLLLSEPDNAQLWIQFMAFHMDIGDIDAAREVAEKALKSIGLAQETEKQAVWIALLNLENAFGDDASVQATLERASQTMEPEDMHSRLASIYIQSGKHEKADELFQTMTKKFTQNPKLWVNYATFLFDTVEEPARARVLLPRALQALPPFAHFDITSKFAQLEFKTKTGVPEEGRTRFQGLVNLYPKRLDLFNIMLDLEMKFGDADQVRGVFDQVLSKNLKPAKAKPFFSRWLTFEKKQGDERKVAEVEARAAKWIQQYQKSS